MPIPHALNFQPLPHANSVFRRWPIQFAISNLRLAAARTLIFGAVAGACITGRGWAPDSPMSMALESVGLLLLLVGAFGRVWCAVHIAGRKNKDLVAVGPFSVMRNPLYFFSMFAFIGAGFCFDSLALGAIFLAVFLLTHWPTILAEEKFLRGTFGASYEAYLARVPRFLPRMALYVPADEVTVGIRAFRRVLVEAACVPLAFLAAQGIEFAHQHGLLPTFLTLY